MHQICFHKSEFATELWRNLQILFISFKKKKKQLVEIVENYSQSLQINHKIYTYQKISFITLQIHGLKK